MKNIHLLSIVLIFAITALFAGCSRVMQIKGSVSGNVYRDGRPMMGQIQIINPRTQNTLKTEPVNNQGHFIISDVPSGEWFLAFIGPNGAPLGEFMYVRVRTGRPETGIVFEIFEKDPKVDELLNKLKAEKEETATGTSSENK